MRLNNPLITSFFYEDKEYEIDLAFDNVLDTFDVLGDKELREYEKAEICLVLLLNEAFEGRQAIELWNYIYESMIFNEEQQTVEYDLSGEPMPTINDDEQEGIIDLKQDAEYIYASFMQAYNINLVNQQGKLHWDEFQALLNSLPEGTKIKEVIEIRSWKPSKDESDERKQSMRKLQKIYALREVD